MDLWRENTLAYGLVVLIIISLVQYIFRTLRNPLNTVPGPLISKSTNLRLKLAVISGQRMHYVHSLHQRYGQYVRIAPREVSVSDPQGFIQIHRVGSGFHKTQWYDELVAFERQSLFTMTDPKLHGARRKLLARGFSKTYLRQFWEPIVHEKAILAVNQMIDESKRSGITDILKWWTFMAADISTHLMFGNSFHALEKGKRSGFFKALESVLKGSGIRAELPIVAAIGKYLPFEASRTMFAANYSLLETAEVAVTNANASGDKNLFAHIIREAEKGEQLDDVDLKIEACGLIVAGSDTTAITLTYLVWAVLSDSATAEALCSELTLLPKYFTDRDLEDLPILNAIIDETLRLYGAAPGGLPRAVPANGASLGGHFLPAGTTVTTQAYTIHRDPQIFPNPSRFDYTRWLSETGDEDPNANKSANPDLAKAILTPFGAGSRACLGIHLARTELRLGTAEFFRRCRYARLAHTTTPETMEMENFFLIAPKRHKCEVVC